MPESYRWSQVLGTSGRSRGTTPRPTGASLLSLGQVTVGTWIDVDVTAAVNAGVPVSFVIKSASTDSAKFATRETANAPQLVVTPLA